MKIALTSEGPELQANMDPRFGRAKYFILYDLESGTNTVKENVQDLGAVHGAGIQAAEQIARMGADALLTGNVGPNAFRTLEAAKIDVYIKVTGTVFEAINNFRDGKLTKAEGANVQGHW